MTIVKAEALGRIAWHGGNHRDANPYLEDERVLNQAWRRGWDDVAHGRGASAEVRAEEHRLRQADPARCPSLYQTTELPFDTAREAWDWLEENGFFTRDTDTDATFYERPDGRLAEVRRPVVGGVKSISVVVIAPNRPGTAPAPELVPALAKLFVIRAKNFNMKGKARDRAAFEFFVGAAAAARQLARPDEGTALELWIAVELVMRGYAVVEEQAKLPAKVPS